MKRTLRILVGIFLTLLLLVTTAICGSLAWRLYRQHQFANLLSLNGSQAIRDGRYVTIGGTRQWISIRGENKANPVILFVHGGPGAGLSGEAAIFRGWEHDFTVVQWDQRGAGLTFAAGAQLTSDIPLDRMTDDGIEVSEYVRRTLGVGRMILVGHSWGSVLGIHMVKARPDLFSAYVGTGQILDTADEMTIAYENTLTRARAEKNTKDVETLKTIGRPPYSSPQDLSVLLQTRNHYSTPSDGHFTGLNAGSGISYTMTSPDLSLGGAFASVRGMLLTAGTFDIYPPLAHADLRALGCDFPIPFFVVEGDDDRVTYTELAKSYYKCINAPHKEFLLIPGGHFAVMTNANAFQTALVQHVRPYVLARAAPPQPDSRSVTP